LKNQTKTYKARRGAQFGDKKAQIYGSELNQLYEKHKKLTPVLLIKEAKKKKSPLHDYFEWNNDKASDKYRLYQARQLIKNIEVTIILEDDEPIVVPQSVHISLDKTQEDSENSIDEKKLFYIPTQDALSNPEYTENILEQAMREIISWKKRYSNLKKLHEIFKVIDKTQKQLKFKSRSHRSTKYNEARVG